MNPSIRVYNPMMFGLTHYGMDDQAIYIHLYPIMFQYSNDIPQWLVKSHIPLYVLTMAHGETSTPWSNYATLDRRRIAFLAQTLIRFSGLWSEAQA